MMIIMISFNHDTVWNGALMVQLPARSASRSQGGVELQGRMNFGYA